MVEEMYQGVMYHCVARGLELRLSKGPNVRHFKTRRHRRFVRVRQEIGE